jgi:hypothetical protein
VTELIDFLRSYGLDVEGIFRRSASVSVIKTLQQKVDLGGFSLINVFVRY